MPMPSSQRVDEAFRSEVLRQAGEMLDHSRRRLARHDPATVNTRLVGWESLDDHSPEALIERPSDTEGQEQTT